MMTRAHRTEKDLKGSLEHLHYEFWMLMSVAQALASGIASQGWLLNALLESFVIHLRALTDFFYPEKPKNDAVIAADFFKEVGAWETIRPPLSGELSKSRVRAHKEIAHLTYARLKVTPETKRWKYIEIANEIRSIMELFLKNAPRNLFGDSWKDFFNRTA
jgi:hypothetical protein